MKIKFKDNIIIYLDIEDFELFLLTKWKIITTKKGKKYLKGSNTYFHRKILHLLPGDYHVHHKDNNGLNCKKENLEKLSPSDHGKYNKGKGKPKGTKSRTYGTIGGKPNIL